VSITNLRSFRSFAIDKNLVSLTLASALAIFLVLTLSATAAQAQTFSVIHNFTGAGGDGANPQAGVTLRNGVLYGTTAAGGSGCGTVYQITHSGSNWTTVPIYAFHIDDGCFPVARVVFGPDGWLYGTTSKGSVGAGVVFYLIPPVSARCETAACYWRHNTVHWFDPITEGTNPGSGDLIWDQSGNMYGILNQGGKYGYGTVWRILNNTTYLTLYSFGNGGDPWGGVILDASGNLYGTTTENAVYELPSPYYSQESILHDLQGNDGTTPFGGLIMDSLGKLYGTTTTGGSGGGGTVFELSHSGFNLLYSFSSGLSYCGPRASLTMDSAGNLYGTTYCDGANSLGNVFKLAKTGNAWVYTSLYDFTGGIDGAYPFSNVSIDTDGTLYGTASAVGQYGDGVVWMIKP
jgi:uncharacterized repeat protein (TIGR03803 family)